MVFEVAYVGGKWLGPSLKAVFTSTQRFFFVIVKPRRIFEVLNQQIPGFYIFLAISMA